MGLFSCVQNAYAGFNFEQFQQDLRNTIHQVIPGNAITGNVIIDKNDFILQQQQEQQVAQRMWHSYYNYFQRPQLQDRLSYSSNNGIDKLGALMPPLSTFSAQTTSQQFTSDDKSTQCFNGTCNIVVTECHNGLCTSTVDGSVVSSTNQECGINSNSGGSCSIRQTQITACNNGVCATTITECIDGLCNTTSIRT